MTYSLPYVRLLIDMSTNPSTPTETASERSLPFLQSIALAAVKLQGYPNIDDDDLVVIRAIEVDIYDLLDYMEEKHRD